MKLLAFDTSTETMSIALQCGSELLAHTGAGGSHASGTMIGAIEALMAQAGLRYAQLDAIVFGRGPGSFTGLRTACAVAQGLALGANLPVLPVDTLQAVAMEAALSGCRYSRVLAALDARMGEVYASYYEIDSIPRAVLDGERMILLLKPAAFAQRSAWPAAWLDAARPVCALAASALPGVALVGNLRPALDAQLPALLLDLPHQAALPSARALLALAPSLMAAGGLRDSALALPLYVRDKVALTTAERLHSAA